LKGIKEYMKSSDAKALKVEVHPSVSTIVEANIKKHKEELLNGIERKILVSSDSDLKANGLRIKEIDIDSLLC